MFCKVSLFQHPLTKVAFQVAQMVKSLPVSAGDMRDKGLIPGSGRSPRVGHGYPLQYFCLENPLNRGAWQAIDCRITKSNTTEAT